MWENFSPRREKYSLTKESIASSFSILHIGDVAGVPQKLSRAQRRMGFKSDVLSFQRHPFDYSADFQINAPFPLDHVIGGAYILRLLYMYDVLHFHCGSVMPYGLDFPIWRIFKKKVIIHHHGSDIRYKKEGLLFSKFANLIFVSTPDLLKWSPNAIWIPNPIDLKLFPYVGVKEKDRNLNIIHAPSNRTKKGTKYIIKAINKLKKIGYKINLILVEKVPYRKAIEYYKQADIVIDQLLIGWYGMVSIECMALGKPVCVYIKDNLEQYLPFMPFLNTSPKNIVENLSILIEDQKMRKELGEKGRKYVEYMHEANTVAKKVSSLYNAIIKS